MWWAEVEKYFWVWLLWEDDEGVVLSGDDVELPSADNGELSGDLDEVAIGCSICFREAWE